MDIVSKWLSTWSRQSHLHFTSLKHLAIMKFIKMWHKPLNNLNLSYCLCYLVSSLSVWRILFYWLLQKFWWIRIWQMISQMSTLGHLSFWSDFQYGLQSFRASTDLLIPTTTRNNKAFNDLLCCSSCWEGLVCWFSSLI